MTQTTRIKKALAINFMRDVAADYRNRRDEEDIEHWANQANAATADRVAALLEELPDD